MVTIKLTPAEARALSMAVTMALHSDFWAEGSGTNRQYAALERAATKLQTQATKPDTKHPCFESKKPSGTDAEDCYGDGWHRCKECWRYTE